MTSGTDLKERLDSWWTRGRVVVSALAVLVTLGSAVYALGSWNAKITGAIDRVGLKLQALHAAWKQSEVEEASRIVTFYARQKERHDAQERRFRQVERRLDRLERRE